MWVSGNCQILKVYNKKITQIIGNCKNRTSNNNKFTKKEEFNVYRGHERNDNMKKQTENAME